MLPYVFNDHPAVGVCAGGVSGDVVHFLQRCVDDVALIGIHRLQRGPAALFQHLLGLLSGVAAERLFPLDPVILCIYADADPAIANAVDRLIGQVLDGVQSFTTAANEHAQILANELHLIDFRFILPGVGVSSGAHALQKAL